ncbi:TIGR03943 family protein [Paenibacillus sp. LMG 31461]|uniref:TIGR03943 family protein n=1 Tax=Paenibacillus plantarum TaxID=2654975 RepID=A0ABX1XND4_9BACL|nr:TIGR03943 family protein [Paenibacillus plantarum]NOU69380.1 TIGR03943 family protein [Paenibacillus plantarum]
MTRWSTFSHRLIRAIVLLAFVFFIVHAFRSDTLVYYVAPRMELWVKCLAVGMYVLAMHQLYLAVNDVISKRRITAMECSCSSHSHHQWKPSIVVAYGALLIPLVLAFTFPTAVLGSQMAEKKGLNLSPSSSLILSKGGDVGTPAVTNLTMQDETDPVFQSNDYTLPYAKLASNMYKEPVITISEDLYIESLTSLDLYQNEFIGKKVQIQGYVYRLDIMNDKQFALGRFAMRCCVADSVPMAILVEADNPEQWKNDRFAVVLGTLEQRKIDGKNVLTIVAKSMETQNSPTSPYVYGNPYFGN